MKRKNIVSKLMSEGFSEKTLAGMTDKQLRLLKGKILPEQTTSGKVLIPQTSPTAQSDIANAKAQKKTIETYEQEELKGSEQKTETSEKETIIKRCNAKIKAAIADGKKYSDYTNAIKKVNNGELPESTKKIIHKHNVNEQIGMSVAEQSVLTIARMKKEPGFGEAESIDQSTSIRKAQSNACSNFISKKTGGQNFNINLKNVKVLEQKTYRKKGGMYVTYVVITAEIPAQVNEIKSWVNKLVESKIYPFTSKNEIMELIQIKLTEQKPQESPHPAEPDIDVEPGKREAPGIDPDDPFRDPHPGIDPNPKAKKKHHKISAEDAKDKIVALLKKGL